MPECWLKRTSTWPEVNDRPVFSGGERYCCTAGDRHAGAPAGWYAAIFGMTGYDGIVACLQQAMADSVRGVLLDIDSRAGRPPARLTALT